MHICPCSWPIGISKKLWIQMYFGLVTVDPPEIFQDFAFWCHGTRLANFFIVPQNCIFWRRSHDQKLFLGILLPEFHFTVFLPLDCGVHSWRVSWRATRDSLLSWRAARGVVKSWEYGRKMRWKEFCPFHENTGFTLTLLEKDPQNSNTEESSENRETFSVSKIWSCDRREAQLLS